MVRFGEPDPWTKEYWRSNLRYHAKGYDPPKGIITNQAVNLHNFDTESPYSQLPGSPHSVEAMQREGVQPDFILYKPAESFNQIGIAPDRVMLRYQAHEALRRETIAMLRKKRQEVAAELEEEEEEDGRKLGNSRRSKGQEPDVAAAEARATPERSLSISRSPSPQLGGYDGDEYEGYESEASEATTRSVVTEVELTHNEQVLYAQRNRLQGLLKKSLKNTKARVQHEKDVQREQDELAVFVNKKMERMNGLAATKVRDQKERMRIAGEREREKLLRLMVMEEEERKRAVHDKEVRLQKMLESEQKREDAAIIRKEKIAADNAEKREAAEERKKILLAECERKEAENKRQMEQKQAEHEVRMVKFEEERARSLEAFRLMQEKKADEAASRVRYITENEEFQAQNAQARRLSEVAQRQFRKEIEKREWKKKKREEAIAKQKKAEHARELCKKKQERREQKIQKIIDKKALVSGRMEDKRKAELDMKLEEAHIIDSGKRERLQRLVARKDYNDASYLKVAEKRIGKIDEAHRFKDMLMKERRLILYEMAQAELEARDDLKLIKLRLPTKKEKEEARQERLKSAKRSSSAMF